MQEYPLILQALMSAYDGKEMLHQQRMGHIMPM